MNMCFKFISILTNSFNQQTTHIVLDVLVVLEKLALLFHSVLKRILPCFTILSKSFLVVRFLHVHPNCSIIQKPNTNQVRLWCPRNDEKRRYLLNKTTNLFFIVIIFINSKKTCTIKCYKNYSLIH